MSRPLPAETAGLTPEPPGLAPGGPEPRRSWRRWLSRRALRLHLALLIVVPGCLAAGLFELTRALAGNQLSWVYVFEWPFFAAFSGRLWWRLLHEEESSSASFGAAPAAGAGGPADDEPADPQLRAWNEYLARLHAESPPGGPPRESSA
jgi:hypothetical protein